MIWNILFIASAWAQDFVGNGGEVVRHYSSSTAESVESFVLRQRGRGADPVLHSVKTPQEGVEVLRKKLEPLQPNRSRILAEYALDFLNQKPLTGYQFRPLVQLGLLVSVPNNYLTYPLVLQFSDEERARSFYQRYYILDEFQKSLSAPEQAIIAWHEAVHRENYTVFDESELAAVQAQVLELIASPMNISAYFGTLRRYKRKADLNAKSVYVANEIGPLYPSILQRKPGVEVQSGSEDMARSLRFHPNLSVLEHPLGWKIPGVCISSTKKGKDHVLDLVLDPNLKQLVALEGVTKLLRFREHLNGIMESFDLNVKSASKILDQMENTSLTHHPKSLSWGDFQIEIEGPALSLNNTVRGPTGETIELFALLPSPNAKLTILSKTEGRKFEISFADTGSDLLCDEKYFIFIAYNHSLKRLVVPDLLFRSENLQIAEGQIIPPKYINKLDDEEISKLNTEVEQKGFHLMSLRSLLSYQRYSLHDLERSTKMFSQLKPSSRFFSPSGLISAKSRWVIKNFVWYVGAEKDHAVYSFPMEAVGLIDSNSVLLCRIFNPQTDLKSFQNVNLACDSGEVSLNLPDHAPVSLKVHSISVQHKFNWHTGSFWGGCGDHRMKSDVTLVGEITKNLPSSLKPKFSQKKMAFKQGDSVKLNLVAEFKMKFLWRSCEGIPDFAKFNPSNFPEEWPWRLKSIEPN